MWQHAKTSHPKLLSKDMLSQQVDDNALSQGIHVPLLKIHGCIATLALSKLKRKDTTVRPIKLLWNVLLISHMPARTCRGLLAGNLML